MQFQGPAGPDDASPAEAALAGAARATGPLCTCGHARQAHEHYRPGSDCAFCDCPRFSRRRRAWFRRPAP